MDTYEMKTVKIESILEHLLQFSNTNVSVQVLKRIHNGGTVDSWSNHVSIETENLPRETMLYKMNLVHTFTMTENGQIQTESVDKSQITTN